MVRFALASRDKSPEVDKAPEADLLGRNSLSKVALLVNAPAIDLA
jgi:hypothetical protein